jgi:hypothetical protein
VSLTNQIKATGPINSLFWTALKFRRPLSPDFLWNLVALASFMRLSLLKGTRAASSNEVWQEIRFGAG